MVSVKGWRDGGNLIKDGRNLIRNGLNGGDLTKDEGNLIRDGESIEENQEILLHNQLSCSGVAHTWAADIICVIYLYSLLYTKHINYYSYLHMYQEF